MINRLRTALVAVIALASAVACVTGIAAPARAASAAPAASRTASAGTWSFIRYSCRTVTAGQVCVAFEGNGQPSTYRAVYALKPRPGQWIRRAYWTETVASPLGGAYPAYDLDSEGYRPFCSSTCAVDRTAATYVRSTRYYGLQTFVFQTPQGSFDLSAGVTTSTIAVDDYCTAPLTVGNSLTSTSDGTVYLARQFHQHQDRPILARLVDGTRTVFTKSWPRGTTLVNYSSPVLYRGWTRRVTSAVNSGAWTVPLSRAYQLYDDSDGKLQKSYTEPGILGNPC